MQIGKLTCMAGVWLAKAWARTFTTLVSFDRTAYAVFALCAATAMPGQNLDKITHSPGTEDEYGACWGFGNTYSYLYCGYLQNDKGRNRMYRWYLSNPVRFQESLQGRDPEPARQRHPHDHRRRRLHQRRLSGTRTTTAMP